MKPDDTNAPQQLLDEGWRVRQCDDRYDLAHDFFSRSLELARARVDKRATAKALLALANNLLWHSPLEIEDSGVTFDQFCEEALELYRDVGDESGIAASYRALWRNEESAEICRRIGDRRGLIHSLQQQGNLAATHNERDRAKQLSREALELARDLGDKDTLAGVLRTIGICSRDDQEYRRSTLLEAAELYRELGYRRARAESLQICAFLACDNIPDLKRQLLEASRDIWHGLGRYCLEAICVDLLAELCDELGDHAAADELRKQSQAIAAIPEAA